MRRGKRSSSVVLYPGGKNILTLEDGAEDRTVSVSLGREILSRFCLIFTFESISRTEVSCEVLIILLLGTSASSHS